MEQVRRIELPSQPWEGHILTIVLHLHSSNIIYQQIFFCNPFLQILFSGVLNLRIAFAFSRLLVWLKKQVSLLA